MAEPGSLIPDQAFAHLTTFHPEDQVADQAVEIDQGIGVLGEKGFHPLRGAPVATEGGKPAPRVHVENPGRDGPDLRLGGHSKPTRLPSASRRHQCQMARVER